MKMRFLLCSVALVAALARAEPAPVETVGTIDLGRYAGKWYEIASFPMFFQRQCIGDTTAEYTLRPDGEILLVEIQGQVIALREGRRHFTLDRRTIGNTTNARHIDRDARAGF